MQSQRRLIAEWVCWTDEPTWPRTMVWMFWQWWSKPLVWKTQHWEQHQQEPWAWALGWGPGGGLHSENPGPRQQIVQVDYCLFQALQRADIGLQRMLLLSQDCTLLPLHRKRNPVTLGPLLALELWVTSKMFKTKLVSVFAFKFSLDWDAETLSVYLRETLSYVATRKRLTLYTVDTAHLKYLLNSKMYNPKLWPEGAFAWCYYEPCRAGVIGPDTAPAAGRMSVHTLFWALSNLTKWSLRLFHKTVMAWVWARTQGLKLADNCQQPNGEL